MKNKINCRRCIYFFVTWQQSQPYGCKAYGFKSAIIPSLVVKKSSAKDCQFFVDKFKK
jgi:hypothetical protein